MNLKEYIGEIDRQFRTGIAREHSYRPALQQLISSMLPHLTVTNEPARKSSRSPFCTPLYQQPLPRTTNILA